MLGCLLNTFNYYCRKNLLFNATFRMDAWILGNNTHLDRFEEHSVWPDVLLVGSDEVLPLVIVMSHSDHFRVLHVHSVLEQYLVLLALELECGGVVLGDIRVRCAVDALN